MPAPSCLQSPSWESKGGGIDPLSTPTPPNGPIRTSSHATCRQLSCRHRRLGLQQDLSDPSPPPSHPPSLASPGRSWGKSCHERPRCRVSPPPASPKRAGGTHKPPGWCHSPGLPTAASPGGLDRYSPWLAGALGVNPMGHPGHLRNPRGPSPSPGPCPSRRVCWERAEDEGGTELARGSCAEIKGKKVSRPKRQENLIIKDKTPSVCADCDLPLPPGFNSS